MVDRLMRHSGRVEHRYYDPTLNDMAKACAQMPSLWGLMQVVEENQDLRLAETGEIADTPHVKPEISMNAITHKSDRLDGLARAGGNAGTRLDTGCSFTPMPSNQTDLNSFSGSGNADYRARKTGLNPEAAVLAAWGEVPPARRSLLIKLLAAMTAIAALVAIFLARPEPDPKVTSSPTPLFR